MINDTFSIHVLGLYLSTSDEHNQKPTSFNRDPSSSLSFFPLSAHFSRFLCFHYLFLLCVFYIIQLDRLCVLRHIKVPFLVAKKTKDNEWFTDFRDTDTEKQSITVCIYGAMKASILYLLA